jgi:hypothetical protein
MLGPSGAVKRRTCKLERKPLLASRGALIRRVKFAACIFYSQTHFPHCTPLRPAVPVTAGDACTMSGRGLPASRPAANGDAQPQHRPRAARRAQAPPAPQRCPPAAAQARQSSGYLRAGAARERRSLATASTGEAGRVRAPARLSQARLATGSGRPPTCQRPPLPYLPPYRSPYCMWKKTHLPASPPARGRWRPTRSTLRLRHRMRQAARKGTPVPRAGTPRRPPRPPRRPPRPPRRPAPRKAPRARRARPPSRPAADPCGLSDARRPGARPPLSGGGGGGGVDPRGRVACSRFLPVRKVPAHSLHAPRGGDDSLQLRHRAASADDEPRIRPGGGPDTIEEVCPRVNDLARRVRLVRGEGRGVST